MPKNRSPPSSNGGGGTSFSRYSVLNGASGTAGSRPCQTYENLDFLYKNPPANSAPSGTSLAPPLPAKSIQRGKLLQCVCIYDMYNSNKTQRTWSRSFKYFTVPCPCAGCSDPQISITTQEGKPLPQSCSIPASHSSSPPTQARHGPPSPNTENQRLRPPRSPLGQATLPKAQRQTWDGQAGVPPTSTQSCIGPVR